MKWLKRSSIVLAILLVLVVAVPFFISFNDYIPRIEKEISTQLKEPVSIKSIRFTALPLPHIAIDGITVGTTGDIKVGTVKVAPDLFSLLRSNRVIKSIEIDALVLTGDAVDKVPMWVKADAAKPPQPPPPFRVEQIRLNNARVSFDKARFGPFDARISLDSTGVPDEASITTQDGKFKALIKSDQSKYLIDASAKAWPSPVGTALVFDELIVKGIASAHDVNLSEVSAKLYGGTAHGKATVSWRKGVQLKGNFDVNHVEMHKIAPMLSFKTHVSGKLDAKPAFSASASSVSRLINALRVETPFSVHNGVLRGVDIQKAATALITQAATGGETHFDQLSGYLVMEHGSYRFTHLKIASGVLAADGDVTISPKRELSGRINAQLKALGVSTGVPLNVAGTVDAPMLYPTGGTMAGAAVGTVILGPGIGTSVGAKIGGWLEGLFGEQDEKRPGK